MNHYRRIIGLSLLLCWVAVAGCNLLPTSSSPTNNSAPAPQTAKADPDHKFKPERISQFIFYSDVELSKKNPLFRELADMRERIVTDLRLPLSNTPVHVHLFEDRDRYEKFVD